MEKPTLPDRLIAWLDPAAAIKRAQARTVLAYYEAAKADRLRKSRRETGSGNVAVLRAGSSLRQQARHFEQNYDLALGVLNTLVANVIGPNGIGVEPQPRRADGSIDDVFAREILNLFKDWARVPEVTWRHDWPSAQRLLARAWLRDGEVFAHAVAGINPYLNHGTRVPYSLEMLEAEYVPMDLHGTQPLVVQGIELNAWGRPLAYHVHKLNPIEMGSLVAGNSTKRVPADEMLHLANVHRIRQLRGVSVFASVLQRFDDLKDYEESERIAAKIAASMAAFIRKGTPDMYEPNADGPPRGMQMRPGMIFDDLKPGEEIGTIDTNRPNPNLETYRSGQLRAVAAGAGPTYSSISRSYDGTYSAQRQELVEGWNIYGTLSNEFIGRIVRPVYEQFIATALASGVLKVPAGVVRDSVDDAIYLAPQMPWIDPSKEADAFATLEDRAYISGPEIIRRRGGNPIDVLEQQARWLREKDSRGIPPPPQSGTVQQAAQDKTAKAGADAAALANMAVTAMGAAMAGREAPAPVVNVAPAAVTVENHIAPAAVTVEASVEPTPVTVSAPVVQVDNHYQPASVHVQVDVPEQAAPVVHVDNAFSASLPASLDMRIVAMPERVTTTAIERDAGNKITTTTQTERDAGSDE